MECWGPVLPTDIKEVLGTCSTPGSHRHEGSAGDLFEPHTLMECWGPVLTTDIKEVLGTCSTPGSHRHEGGAGDLF